MVTAAAGCPALDASGRDQVAGWLSRVAGCLGTVFAAAGLIRMSSFPRLNRRVSGKLVLRHPPVSLAVRARNQIREMSDGRRAARASKAVSRPQEHSRAAGR